MPTSSPLHALSTEYALQLAGLNQAPKRTGMTDDYMCGKAFVEWKSCKVTANQVQPLKFDVAVFDLKDGDYIVATASELFPLLTRQHASHRWDCSFVSKRRLLRRFPTHTQDELDQVIELKSIDALEDSEFRAKQTAAREIYSALNTLLNQI